MQVIINEGGLSCTTVNPFKEPNINDKDMHDVEYFDLLQQFRKAESERQTFEIDKVVVNSEFQVFNDTIKTVFDLGIKPGTTHSAEIVNGKAVIK